MGYEQILASQYLKDCPSVFVNFCQILGETLFDCTYYQGMKSLILFKLFGRCKTGYLKPVR